MIINYITCKDKKEAEKIGGFLIKKKLAACLNMFPTSSLYIWKKKLTKDNEYVLLAKSANKNSKKIIETVEKIHSYELPCIIQLNVKANKEFERWVNENSY